MNPPSSTRRRRQAALGAAATDRHRQPLARTVPRELMFKGLRPIDGDRVASCPRRRRPQDRWRRATKTLSCYRRDLLRAQERSVARGQTRLAAEIDFGGLD